MDHPDNPFTSIPVAQIGQLAVIDEKLGINISTQRRLEMALSTDPAQSQHALALTQREAKKVTQNRMRNALSELAHGKIDKVAAWIDEVAEKDPARAVELFMQLAEFAIPRLKAVTLEVSADTKPLREMSIAQLEAMMNGDDSVVSSQ